MPSIKELKETLRIPVTSSLMRAIGYNSRPCFGAHPGQDRILMKPHSFGFEEIRPNNHRSSI